MKLLIITALLALAAATEFRIKGKDGKTCALLTLDGSLDLSASQDGGIISKKSLPFSGASVFSPSCELIKLNLTESAEVWFQFDSDQNNWKVTPKTTFDPEMVFGEKVNDTTAVVMEAKSLTSFPKSSSYLCNSATTFTFESATAYTDYNFTATASVTDFQIQSVVSETFKTGLECPADAKPKDYLCKDGNKTMITMDGNFTMVISYNKTVEGKVVMANQTIQVPAPQDAETSGTCAAKAAEETLNIKFFKDWAIEFTFAVDGDYYHVSNISVDFTYDDNLPNHTETGSRTVHLLDSKDYLKASKKGYYICNAHLDLNKDTVTLTSTDFKYRAFDSEHKGFSDDAEVSECTADESSNSVVPIAVGAVLAGLVVIVLVVYLIGRKRSRKTGYESV